MVGEAVAAFCSEDACDGPAGPPGEQGPPGEPGGGVTPEEAEAIASRVVVEYLSGRAIWCYPEPQASLTIFGPCYVSSG